MKRQTIKFEFDSDEGPESIQKPCFFIDENNVPRGGGEEYLLSVINERKQCPDTVISNINLVKFRKNQTRFVTEVPGISAAPACLKPTIEWQNIQVANFSHIRMYLNELRSSKESWPELIPCPYPYNISTTEDWLNHFSSCKPILRCVLAMTQHAIAVGLEVLTECLDDIPQGEGLPYWQGEWIYALLACLQQPLPGDTVSLIRNLARKCSQIRSHLPIDEETSREIAAPFNIFICLVARYFVQKDLAD